LRLLQPSRFRDSRLRVEWVLILLFSSAIGAAAALARIAGIGVEKDKRGWKTP
jgi:hypothetical protein